MGRPLEEDLASWGHDSSSTTVPDVILQASAGEEVPFGFHSFSSFAFFFYHCFACQLL
uniref:Uncharacterized protein n=1 Tax=Nymphaea colorata TaxID=210225 RepID=A0A5K1BJU4_9MAGN